VAIDRLKPHPTNPRRHTGKQIKAIARSIDAFGFNAPVLVDKNYVIVAGHCRVAGAKAVGMTSVPVIFLDHLTEEQARAYLLADNKLNELSSWDEPLLAVHFKELSALSLDFEIEATGFEPAEIDLLIQSAAEPVKADDVGAFSLPAGPPVAHVGDLWILGPHQICCGNALEVVPYAALFEGEKATAVFTDPPYNVRIDGHATGKGRHQHREFAMASGEMSEAQFTEFLTTALKQTCGHTLPGALIYACMDWRHLWELQTAGRAADLQLINLCVWAKTNDGMGSLYRSGHELILVFKNGNEPHVNNVQLGRFGRNRSNVWNYAGANSFARKGSRRNLDIHPTVKPLLMVADAILDCTNRDDIVLDPFLGSGTTVLAAERTGRRCYGIELDPLYVDAAIERWQRMSGQQAKTADGEPFDIVRAKRSVIP
jgi:DNA modification methylase